MNVFYISEVRDGKAFLYEEEARHCIRVMRMKAGDLLTGTDGNGGWYQTRILESQKDRVLLEIIDKQADKGEHSGKITLAVSPLRLPDRFEWIIEKGVELGVTSIIPVLTERTVKSSLKVSRLEKIMLSALKQSCRSRLPALHEAVEFDKWIRTTNSDYKLIAHCDAEQPITGFREGIEASSQITFLIGPEGDFTPAEISSAITAGFLPVSYGEVRLRTETAAIFSLSVIKFLKGW